MKSQIARLRAGRLALLTAATLALMPLPSWSAPRKKAQRRLAFPSAEGWGRHAAGGRGGRVIYVDNLNDSGPGSLRDAVEQRGARTVVFSVSGTIALLSPLRITNDSLTIAGQTAPGDGICLRDCPLSVSASDVIIRYIRVRVGDKFAHDYDAVTGGRYGQHDVIIDHVSASWSIDECFSLYKVSALTVQWCMMTHSLAQSRHTKGAHGFGGIWGGLNATWHHNLLADHTSRNPRFASVEGTKNVDYRNNVVWNYGFKAAYGGGRYGEINFVGNYYKPGPASEHHRFLDVADDGTGLYYLAGNVMEGDAAVTADNRLGVGGKGNPSDCLVGHPFEFMPIHSQRAEEAYALVLDSAGCSRRRDSYDRAVIEEVRTGRPAFSSTGIVNSPDECGGWPVLRSTPPPADTDRDGMADSWERSRGLTVGRDDSAGYELSGEYTNLEVYLESLL